MTVTDDSKPGPLAGLRVLDCSTVIAGPMVGQLLADYGADVIKIEHPTGDTSRRGGTPVKGFGLKYKVLGRNKRHVVINFSTPEGQELLKGLAEQADILVENFRPGVMEKWNIGWEDLHALNPKLIMLRITGFGQFGPYSRRPGYGTLAEAMSGFANGNGYSDGPPTLPAFGLADGIAALAGLSGILMALHHRDANGGKGQMIDVALIEPIFHMLVAQASIWDLLGKKAQRLGNRTENTAPRNTYQTKEGRWVAISATSESIARRVMTLVGKEDLIDEPWFSSGGERAKRWEIIDPPVAKWIGEHTLDEISAKFEEIGAAVAPIYDIEQIIADPQYQALQTVVTVDDEDIGPMKMQNVMFRMSETPGKIKWGGRRLGQDTDDVLGELLGLSESRLKELHDLGVIEPAKKAPAPAPV